MLPTIKSLKHKKRSRHHLDAELTGSVGGGDALDIPRRRRRDRCRIWWVNDWLQIMVGRNIENMERWRNKLKWEWIEYWCVNALAYICIWTWRFVPETLGSFLDSQTFMKRYKTTPLIWSKRKTVRAFGALPSIGVHVSYPHFPFLGSGPGWNRREQSPLECRGNLYVPPCLPNSYHEILKQGKGTDDHLLPLGYWPVRPSFRR